MAFEKDKITKIKRSENNRLGAIKMNARVNDRT